MPEEKIKKTETKGKTPTQQRQTHKIRIQTSNVPKPRCLETSIRTHSTTARAVCHHKSSAILLQQALNSATELNQKKLT